MADETRDPPLPTTPSLRANWISLAGAVLAGAAFFAAASLIAIDIFRGFANPYLGILTYLVAPAFLALGMLLIALGAARERRRRRDLEPGTTPAYPRIDLGVPHQRHVLAGVVVVTAVILLFTALGTYRAYGFTESVAFCGQTCHGVMRPEYTAYQESPHARVPCVDCHIGPGATWFVRSKLSGVYQVYATIAGAYHRPIPAPIEHLRPAQDTCEQCHWPRKFYGATQRIFRHRLGDEKNSPWTVEMLLRIGGGDAQFGPAGGIHWHMNIANKVEYIATDRERQVIPWVRITDGRGNATVYQTTDDPLRPEQIAAAQPRVMDCIDCHNRPTHIYDPPVYSVDLAMATNRIDPAIPFIKKEAVLALTGKYATTADALTGMSRALRGFYSARYPEFAARNPRLLEDAFAAVEQIYVHNFFPDMKADWRAYADNVGHKDFPGCYRCHDGKHVSADGKRVTHDCDACHTIVAQGAEGSIERRLEGLAFRHPVDIGDVWKQASCSDCHDGALVQ